MRPTVQAFKAGDGWFDTGDLGWRAPAGVAGSSMAGNIVLTGVGGEGRCHAVFLFWLKARKNIHGQSVTCVVEHVQGAPRTRLFLPAARMSNLNR